MGCIFTKFQEIFISEKKNICFCNSVRPEDCKVYLVAFRQSEKWKIIDKCLKTAALSI